MSSQFLPGVSAWLCASALLACVCSAAHAQSADSALAACEAEAVTIVAPHAGSPADARALWVSDTQLRWPARANQGRFKLYYADQGGMLALPGRRISGAQASAALSAQSAAGFSSEGFRYLGSSGVLLSAADVPQTTLQLWLRGQLLVVHEDERGRVLDATATQPAAWIDSRFAPARAVSDLGVTLSADDSAFALWAPTARAVSLCIYPSATAKAAQSIRMQMDPNTGVWRARSTADLRGQYYRYALEVYARGAGLVRNLVSDPYALSLNANGERAFIAELNDPALMPAGWTDNKRAPALKSASDMVIYELHVRDFSANDATVDAPMRGKMLAFTQSNSRGMKHLRGLADAGLSDVHLLPAFDFATVPEQGCSTPEITRLEADSDSARKLANAARASDCFNWGYDPKHFGAVEGSYASDAQDGAKRIVEFRAMVDALHRIGLRVGLDVVYNHTSHAGQQAQSVLDRIVPDYYHRLSASGEVERSTCCDNTATEHAMMAKLMIDTAVRWVRDYRIDSFRFDLMGHQPLPEMLALQRAVNTAAGRTIHLLGEGWNFGEVANNARFVQAAQNNLQGSGIASFSDRARDAARGGGCCDSGNDLIAKQGFLNGLGYDPNHLNTGHEQRAQLLRSADLMRVGLAGSLADFALQDHTGQNRTLSQIDYAGQAAGYIAEPTEVVNYVENHDNPTLYDINALRLPRETTSAERARVQVLGSASVLLSQGIAYLHAGQEILRSKSLDRNSYDSGDWFNRIDWTLQDNGFASGLPLPLDSPQNDALMRPVLKNPNAHAAPEDIQFTLARTLELLRVRRSTALLRLPTAAQIQARLRFFNVGPEQIPSVLAAHIDGRELPELPLPADDFAALVFLINVDTKPHTLTLPEAWRGDFALHPALLDSPAGDARRAEARYDKATGQFDIPARSALVYVRLRDTQETN
jgi:pullulanase